MKNKIRTACTRDCPDACGIIATVEEGRVLSIAGDPRHPVTRGYLCERTGRYLKRQYARDRLNSPLKKRGNGFVEVGWDEALDFIAENLQRLRSESGPESVLHYRSGGSLGMMKVVNDYFFECFGGARVKKGDICSGAGEAAQIADMGISESQDLHDLPNSSCILLWGKNVTTSFVHLLPVLKEARKRGASVVLLDPAPGKTARFADWTLRPRPASDRFLVLAMVQVAQRHNWLDPALPTWSRHHDVFLELAHRLTLPELSRRCDIPVTDIEKLTEMYAGKGPANIQIGWGLQRRLHGAATVRCLDALAALTGNLGVSGGGATFYYRRRHAFLTSPYTAPEERRGIPEPLLGQGILDANEPPVRGVVIDNGNPVAMLPDSLTVRRALLTRELVVVLEQFMTDTAECADVVLPVTTMLEEDDLLGGFGHHYLTASQPVATRPASVKSDLEIYQALAERLGFGDRLSGTAEEWQRRLLPGDLALEALRQGAVGNPRAERILFANREFATSDGKFHFITDLNLDQASLKEPYPLLLGSFSTPEAQSSQWSRDRRGEPIAAQIHPGASGALEDGALAWVVSRKAKLRVRLRHNAALRPDLVCLPKGGWLMHQQAANSLIEAQATDDGLGAAYYDEPVRIDPV